MHDIGRLALMKSFGAKRYADFVRAAGTSAQPLTEIELEHFGIDHCKIGKLLLQHWRLPEDLAEAATHHHSPESWSANRMLRTLGCACAVSATLGFAAVTRPQAPLSDIILAALPNNLRSQFLNSPEAVEAALNERVNSLQGVKPAGPPKTKN